MNLNDLFNAGAAGIAGMGLTEANRPIRLRLSHQKGVMDDVLLVKHVSGVESICGGIEYRLLCVSTQTGLPLKDFIGMPVELQLVTDAGNRRAICGLVDSASEGESDGGLSTYLLTLRDALSIMEKTNNTRIFRNKSEVDITQIILGEWCATNPALARAFRFNLGHLKSYPAREMTMQLNESNAAFLRRLWKRRGLAWFIEHGQVTDAGSNDTAGHTLVLFDDNAALVQNVAGVVRYHRDDGTEARDSITAWHALRNLSPGSVTRQSWDYQRAKMMRTQELSRNDQGTLGNQFAAGMDDYLADAPHTGDDNEDYRSLGTLRMQRHEYDAKCFQGESGVRDLCIGQWIGLTGHAEIDTHPDEEQEFVITELRIAAENNLPKTLNDRARRLFAQNRWSSHTSHELQSTELTELEQANARRNARYLNRFTCVRRGIAIVPTYDPRIDLPRTPSQTAIVVGPQGETIYCDEQGRVKVCFPACRPEDHAHANGAGASDSERDSAWVRVASSWAGAQWGSISLPRIGQEVEISFLGHDPDKPIITGSTHNSVNPPPSFSGTSRLPDEKALSGIVSKEIHGNGYNQLRIDDTLGEISAQLASSHGHSQLNLGYLTQPRQGSKGDARGEGAELRSDHAVAIRGGQGVYISADARLRASGRQLERDGLIGLAEVLKSLQQQLADLATTHHADDTDGKPLAQLNEHVKQWEHGSNTDKATGAATAGGQPIVAINAPAGMLLGSEDNIAIGAQTHVDIVSVGNTQLSTGHKLLMRAAQSISLFAHKLGMKLIAASGKIEIQAHQDNIELISAKRIVFSAAEEIVFQAPKVTMLTQGAQVNYGGGAVTYQCSGAYTIKSASFAHSGPGDANPRE